MALAMVTFTACASTGQNSGAAEPEAETNTPAFSSNEARREYLTGHVFKGRWSSGYQSGDSKLVFYEIAGQLVVSLYDVDGDGTKYDATVSSSKGMLEFQITENNQWELELTSEKTLEGVQWYDGSKNNITLNDVSRRTNTADPAPVYPVDSAEELTELLVEHSPFEGKWHWGTDRSADVRFTFRNDEDQLSVEAMLKGSSGSVTNTTVPVSVEEASTDNNRVSFETSSWGSIVLKLRTDGIYGVIKYLDGTALRFQLPPDTSLNE